MPRMLHPSEIQWWDCRICRGRVAAVRVVTALSPEGTWIGMCPRCDRTPHKD